MIGYFPDFYPDELVYSLLSRYYAKTGYLSYTFAAQDLFTNKRVRPDIEFLNDMTIDAYKHMTQKVDIESIVHNHTMFDCYGRFISAERRKKAFEALVNMRGNYHNFLCIPKTNNIRYLKYCPECVKDDRAAFGETYWHRKHQINEIKICYKHFCVLKESNVIISGRASPSLQAAEQSITDVTPVFSKSRTERKVVSYISSVIDKKLLMDNNVQVGKYINNKLTNTKYLKGKLRDMDLLTKDFNEYYAELGTTIELWQLQKIFTRENNQMYDVCKLAMFLGISAKDISNMILTNTTKNISRTVIWREKPGIKTKDWTSIDSNLYPKVTKAVREIYGIGNTRPKKVSVHAVTQKLNLTDKSILNMPKCMKIIEQYSETQEEYWAREISWAVKKLSTEGKVLNWKHIRELINITKTDLKRAWKSIDEETVKIIESLI